MNFIKSLQAENAALKRQIQDTNIGIQDFILFLNSEKFVGVQSDGSRKDWISTTDTIYKLRDLKLPCMVQW